MIRRLIPLCTILLFACGGSLKDRLDRLERENKVLRQQVSRLEQPPASQEQTIPNQEAQPQNRSPQRSQVPNIQPQQASYVVPRNPTVDTLWLEHKPYGYKEAGWTAIQIKNRSKLHLCNIVINGVPVPILHGGRLAQNNCIPPEGRAYLIPSHFTDPIKLEVMGRTVTGAIWGRLPIRYRSKGYRLGPQEIIVFDSYFK